MRSRIVRFRVLRVIGVQLLGRRELLVRDLHLLLANPIRDRVRKRFGPSSTYGTAGACFLFHGDRRIAEELDGEVPRREHVALQLAAKHV